MDHGRPLPIWLVGAVLVLLAAVVGVGAYLVVQAKTGAGLAGDQPTPVEEWAAAVEADPTSVEARVSFAFALQSERRWDDAADAYTDALELDPDNLAALYNRGVCSIASGHEPAGETDLKRVLRIAPEHALAAKALAELYARAGRYSEMPAALERASRANPGLADLHALLGLAYEKTGDREAALEEYRGALRLDPQLAEVRAGLKRLEGATSGD